MFDRFTMKERQALGRRLAQGLTDCPRCGGPLERHEVPPRRDLAYVRHRVWFLCSLCRSSAVLDRRHLDSTHGGSMRNRTVTFRTSQGLFRAELYEDRAPMTSANFVSLVEKEFYDGVIFHRVIDGFMIQGGDPTETGRGGPGYTIADEFGPGLGHDAAGILSMANAGPDTGGSQFFITIAPTPWLDRKHAVFGRVVEGMDVVRNIGKVKTARGDRPVEDVVMKEVKVEAGIEP